jgi:translation initiation factor SUI1
MADLNLFNGSTDPFLTGIEEGSKEKLHIRIQTSGKRVITLVEGLDPSLDLKNLIKKMKATFSCAVSIHVDEKSQQNYIKLQGDHRNELRDWLIKEKIVAANEAKERIVIHGY